jgi:hypothetical protein
MHLATISFFCMIKIESLIFKICHLFVLLDFLSGADVYLSIKKNANLCTCHTVGTKNGVWINSRCTNRLAATLSSGFVHDNLPVPPPRFGSVGLIDTKIWFRNNGLNMDHDSYW